MSPGRSTDVAPEIVGSEFVPCVCGKNDDDVILVGKDTINWRPGTYRVVRCRSCALVRTSPRPAAHELGEYYPDSYGPYRSGTPRGLVRRTVKRWIPPSNDSIIPPFSTPGSALEIGCSHGSFLDWLHDEGWEVAGVEFSETAAKAARNRGHHVQTGRVEDLEFPLAGFDLVTAWMVVEHLGDPVLALRKAASWSKAGARLALSVPNLDSASFRRFGTSWFNLQVPNHFYHYTPKSIEEVLRRGGWRLDEVHFQVTLRSTVESARLRFWPRPLGKRAQKAWRLVSHGLTLGLLPVAVRQARLGQADRMTIWATRMD
jgi:SAM-dependent methyltransferase